MLCCTDVYAEPLPCESPESDAQHLQKISADNATRLDENTLSITWLEGEVELKNEPPFDVPLAGVRYYYCTFYKKAAVHHILKEDQDILTGLLVSHATGKIIDAGYSVLFSPDHTAFFATRQPNGLDGQEWYVFEKTGKLLWQGFSGIIGVHPELKIDIFESTFDYPEWNDNNQLTTQARCGYDFNNANPTKQVTLKINKDGWQWLPKLNCTNK